MCCAGIGRSEASRGSQAAAAAAAPGHPVRAPLQKHLLTSSVLLLSGLRDKAPADAIIEVCMQRNQLSSSALPIVAASVECVMPAYNI